MKKLFLFVVFLVVLLLGTALIAPYFLDLNKYKDKLVAVVKEKTGYTLAINGEIGFSIIPDIALKVDDVVLRKNEQENANLVALNKLVLKLQWKPLLEKRIEVDSFELVEPAITLQVAKDGTANWQVSHKQDTADASNEQVATASQAPAEKESDVAKVAKEPFDIQNLFQFNEVKIIDGSLSYNDLQKEVSASLTELNLATTFKKGSNAFQLSGIQESLGRTAQKFSFSGDFSVSDNYYVELSNVNLTLGPNKAIIDASIDTRPPAPELKLVLFSEELRLESLLPPLKQVKEQKKSDIEETLRESAKASSPIVWSDEPLPFDALGGINGQFGFKVNKLYYNDLLIERISFNSFLRNGKFKANLKEMLLYEGNISGESVVDISTGQPTITNVFSVNGVNLGVIPETVLPELKYFSGILSFDNNITTKGASPKALVSALNGDANIDLSDGSLKGIALVDMTKNIASAFKVGNKEQENKTGFQSIKGAFAIRDGVIANDDTLIDTKHLDFSAKGTIDLPKFFINYRLTPRIGGEETNADGIMVPVIIKGRLDKPVFLADVISPINSLIQNPDAAEEAFKKLKDDFEGIGKEFNKKSDDEKVKAIENIFKGLQ